MKFINECVNKNWICSHNDGCPDGCRNAEIAEEEFQKDKDRELLMEFAKEFEKYNYERGLGGDSNIQPEHIDNFLTQKYKQ